MTMQPCHFPTVIDEAIRTRQVSVCRTDSRRHQKNHSLKKNVYLLLLAHKDDTGQDLLVSQLAVAHNGTATLDGLNDFGGLIASQSKACGVAVDLHGSPQCLLSPTRHAAATHIN